MLNSLSRPEFQRKRRNKLLLRLGLFFFTFVFLVGLVSYAAHRPSIRISNVELVGGVLVTQSDVAEKSQVFLSGSYFWLLPKNNGLWYPRGGLEKYLADELKRIDTIHIERKSFNTIIVQITERKPEALWCDKLSEEEKCYFLDQNSAIFAEAPNFSGDAYFKYYGLVSTATPIGQYYIASTTEFAEVRNFVENTKQLSLKPQYIIGKDAGEFSLIIGGGGQIYFDTKELLSKAASNLEALLKTSALSQNISHLDYIDLRFGNKLYYKLK